MTTPAAASCHAGLVALARREQALLAAALGSLFTNPDLDMQISCALGYPGWPQPITLLPTRAPELADITPQLAAYLAFVGSAAAEAIATISEHGWPDPAHPGASDAAWLLLQHADAQNEQRRALLPALAGAVRGRAADPRHLALLTDRARAVQGEPQRYGTLRLIRDERPVLLYPLAARQEDVDRDRDTIGLPRLAEDAKFAYSPLMPYGTARTCPTNPWPSGRPDTLHPEENPTLPSDVPRPLPAGSIGVYLGATLRYRNQMRRVRDALPVPFVSTGRWLDIDPLTRASCQFDAGLALNQLAARLCLADVTRSDLVIAFAENRRSHGLGIEIGAGLAQRKPVIIIGDPRCSFDMLPEVTIVADLDEALALAAHHTAYPLREPT
jgi:hypothetical protein